jgi:CelD/BcsL family acetyltransferase involved in cellulose biosynthesis/GNAT superfamily N-acetyltransferase
MIDMPKVERIDSYEAFRALAPTWDTLVSQTAGDTIFMSHAWLDTWWNIFGDDHDLYTLIVKSDDEIIGIAPLMRTPQQIIRFMGTPNADYGDVIGADKRLIIQHMYDYLVDHRDDWRRIELQEISDKFSALEEFRAVISAGELPYNLKMTSTCTAYEYDGPEEERHDFILRRNKTMRNNMNFFIRSGGLELIRVQDPDEIERHLPAFFHGHIVRWDGTPTPSKFLKERDREFFHANVKNLATRGLISLMLLMHGDRPIGYFFTYDYKQSLYLYTTVFEIFYSKRSPGLILINMMTSLFVQLGYKTIDHTRGAEGYKRHFTNTSHQNHQIVIYREKSGFRRAKLVGWLKYPATTDLVIRNKRLANLKTRVTARLYNEGAASLLKIVARKVIRALYDHRVMLVVEHTGAAPRPMPLPPKVTIEQLGEDDIELIASFLGFEADSRKHKVVKRRFENGGECFVARHNGTIAAIAWGMFKEDYLTDVDKPFPLGKNEVDLGDDYTSPVFRGLGLHSLLIAHRVQRYSDRNLRKLSTILRDNIPSLKNYRKNDFAPVGKIRRLKLFGIKVV